MKVQRTTIRKKGKDDSQKTVPDVTELTRKTINKLKGVT